MAAGRGGITMVATVLVSLLRITVPDLGVTRVQTKSQRGRSTDLLDSLAYHLLYCSSEKSEKQTERFLE